MEATAFRCHCGDPMLESRAGWKCDHCDTRAGCGKEHDSSICARCIQMAQWEPWPGYLIGQGEP